ncbi:21915_t:CDS:2 [Gigaspora margarita]|uniref:21915_t:CDS:1 n=1 Tax=Gigaspora margarita TaxID=4874 RepID=A0ABN7U787_GIGMA|nr:21915_t:CDS:2 [Gigaspora margarita]
MSCLYKNTNHYNRGNKIGCNKIYSDYFTIYNTPKYLVEKENYGVGGNETKLEETLEEMKKKLEETLEEMKTKFKETFGETKAKLEKKSTHNRYSSFKNYWRALREAVDSSI